MKIVKKWLCICLSLALFACLCACTGDEPKEIEQSSEFSEGTSQESSVADSGELTTSDEASSADTTEDSSISEETQSSYTSTTDTTSDVSEDSSTVSDSSVETTEPSVDSSVVSDSSDEPDSSEVPPVEPSKEPDESSAELGTSENPMAMVIGNNTITLEDGKGEICYGWTATEDATLMLEFSDENKVGWAYTVCNLTAGPEFTKIDTSSAEDAESIVYLSVLKGDSILVVVDTEKGTAGKITLKTSLLEAWGTESSPITIAIGRPNYLRVPAGKTVYFSGRPQNTTMAITGASDSVLEFEGESHKLKNGKLTLEMPKSEGGKADVLYFALTNNTGAMQVYSVSCDYPLGTPDNPAQVNLGSNSIQIEAGNQYGYVYEWTATAKGTVTITMTGSNWHYEILNIDTMVQEQSNSNEDTPVNEATITVRKGQVVRITINTGDGNAAKVSFNFSFN